MIRWPPPSPPRLIPDRGRSQFFLTPLRSFESVSITSGDRADATTDVFVGLVVQVSQRYAQRPVGASKPLPLSRTIPWSSAKRKARSSG